MPLKSLAVVVVASTFLTAANAGVLLNPSFESPSVPGGDVFGAADWVVFGGNTYTSNLAPHSGQNVFKAFGDISGAFQEFPAEPGSFWQGSVWALNPDFDPMAGGQIAAVNIEWRDSAENLISYESTVLLTASSPAGSTSADYFFGEVAGAAPPDTASVRFVLITGGFAGPGGGGPRFDDASFQQVPEPSLSAMFVFGLLALAFRHRRERIAAIQEVTR
jgi:hypothetical protein